ncbi:MAG: hypothetical protein ABJA71_03340 [Ginsengibacter sp.]
MLVKKRLMHPASRRLFLKKSLMAGMACAGNPFRQFLPSFRNETKYPAWSELVEYARWCPSVHNLQPHKLKIISQTEAELYCDPARLLPVGDPHAIFVTVAMGIFHEHLSIAASSYRKKIEISKIFEPIKTGKTSLQFFAKLKLVSADEEEALNRDLMLARRTSRLHYNGRALKQATIAKIKSGAEKFGHEFFSSSDPGLVDYIIHLNDQTLFQDISVKADREELDHLFRYSKKEAQQHKDGLWARCMGFPGVLMKSVFEHPEKWHRGLGKAFLSKHYKASFKGTATICWFGGRFNNTGDWLNAGKMLARNWLLITKEKAYIHPFGSLITNEAAYEKINRKFTQPREGKKIWMIFRAGYSKQPARSFRLSTEEIIFK